MIDEYTGKKIIRPLDCTLSCNMASEKSYSVIASDMTTPVAVFTCFHCASNWRDENISRAQIKEIPIALRSAFSQV